MALGKKILTAPARLWLNWPLWGGLLATLLLAKHAWVLFAPAEHAVPATTVTAQTTQAEQLFGVVTAAASSASLNGIRPVGIFASSKHGFAVLMTEAGQVGVGVGGEVVPGVRLVETHPDYVILEHNGVRQRVDLSKAPAAVGGITPAGEAAPVRNDIPPVAKEPIPALDQLTPEQRTILLQEQQKMIRGRP